MCCEANMFAQKWTNPGKGWEQRGNRTEWNPRNPKKVCFHFTSRRAVGIFLYSDDDGFVPVVSMGVVRQRDVERWKCVHAFLFSPQNKRCYCPTALPRLLFIQLTMFFPRVYNARNVYWDEIEPYPIHLLSPSFSHRNALHHPSHVSPQGIQREWERLSILGICNPVLY